PAVAVGVARLAHRLALGVEGGPGVGLAVAVGVALLHLQAALVGLARGVHDAVEVGVLFGLDDLVAGVADDDVGLAVAVRVLLGAHARTLLEERDELALAVAVAVLFDARRLAGRVEARDHVGLAVAVAILAL